MARQDRAMVIRTRLRAVLFPLALYAFSGGVTSYFIWHADNGERGSKARIAYKHKIKGLEADLAALREERQAMQLKAAQFQTDSVDRDLLDEQAHRVLGRAHKNELVVSLPTAQN
jgi:cell division protein FtsB